MRILLVEDDHLLAASLSEALEAQRYTVDIAHDGDIAWPQMAPLPYDLMLMTVLLRPKMSEGLSR